MYLFAKHIETKEVFEILSIEIFQGHVTYMDIMDTNGAIQGIDEPNGFEYYMEQEKEGD